ncbi:hypothetical protein P5E48_11545 [Clostridium perfringens]|nr:hypothetical protein [Clostridium perfringens]MDK0793864.1 hypothetical protein [Clostridium perfringens]
MNPDRINTRASLGRVFRRKSGAYNCGNNIPFGYKKISSSPEENKISKSKFIEEEVKIDSIKYLFESFKLLMQNEKDLFNCNYKNLLKNLKNNFELLINNIFDNNSFSDISDDLLYEYRNHKPSNEFLLSVKVSFKANKSYTLDALNSIKNHFLIFPKTKKSRPITNIEAILTNIIYGGYILEFSKDYKEIENKFNSTEEFEMYKLGLKKLDETNFLLDNSAVIKTQNIKSYLNEETFQKVYCYLVSRKYLKFDFTPNFLFKNELRCSCGGKFIITHSEILICKKCNLKFIKNDILNFIIETLLKKIISNNTSGFSKFKAQIENEIKKFEFTIDSLTKTKLNTMKTYLQTPKSNLDKEFIKKNIDDICSKLDKNKQLCCECRKKLNNITSLEDIFLNKDNEINKNIVTKIYSEIFYYINSNEKRFYLLFQDVIKEIKVVVNKDVSKLKVVFEYNQ